MLALLRAPGGPLLESAGAEERLIEVSHGVELLEFEVDHEQAHEDEGEGDGHDLEGALYRTGPIL